MRIDFYLSIESIWTHIGYQAILRTLRQHGATPRLIPVDLRALFAATGGIPFRERHAARQRYRDFEVQRWCARRGVTLNLDSPHLPPKASLADRVVIACDQAGHDPLGFVALALEATWCERRDIGDPAVVADCAARAELPAGALLRAAQADEAQQIYQANLARAVDANVFGTPSLVRDGEVFWGQDRLEMLEEALASRRPAWKPLR